MGGAQAGAWRLETGIVLEAGYVLDVMKWMGGLKRQVQVEIQALRKEGHHETEESSATVM